MAGHDDLRRERLESIEHGNPLVAVHVRVVGREVREDGKASLLDEVAGEEDPLLRQEHHLVSEGVRLPPRPELHRAAAQVEGRDVALVDGIRLDQLDTVESRRRRSSPKVRNISR